jgi:hypothetical protein
MSKHVIAFRTTVMALVVLLVVSRASAQLTTGDVVFLQDALGSQKAAVLKADQTNGNRTVISQFGVRGAGPDFNWTIGGIDFGPNGDLFVPGNSGTAIFRIDPASGDRTIISSSTVGTGPALDGEGDLVIAPTGDIFVTASNKGSIIRVDPTTGNRFLVSGPGQGSGQGMVHPTGLSRTPSGDFFAFETSASTPDDDLVFFVNGATGDRSIVSGGNIGSGPAFNHFGFDVADLLDDDVAAVDHANRILRVHPSDGARSILAGPGVGSGPDLGGLEWLTLDSSGFLIASSVGDGIYRVDPTNGNRTIITGNSYGTGPALGGYREAVTFTSLAVPEPSGLFLAVSGIIGFLAFIELRIQCH